MLDCTVCQLTLDLSPKSDKQLVYDYLQTGWHSSFEIDNYIKSSQGQRRCRELQAQGLIESMWQDQVIGGKKKRWKIFKVKE